MADEDGLALIGEVEATIKDAAKGANVVVIRLAIGKEVSVAKSVVASELHKRFPSASIEIKESAITDSIVVKDIEVE